jgi:hypothetical protein
LNACFTISGKCYKCNSSRGLECSNNWLWSNGFSEGNVGWWYTEIACNGGSLSSSSSASNGVCLAYPLSSTPADPLNACFTVNGRCYKCDSDRGAECSNNWLWNNGFSEGNVGYWYTEIACNGVSNKCSDNALLRKSMLDRDSENVPTDESYPDYVWRKDSKFFYDAMGRRTQAHPETRRYLFLPKRSKTAMVDFGALLKEETVETNVCGKLRIDYGIKEDTLHIGGITCPQVVPKAMFIPNQAWPEDSEKCSDGNPMFRLDNVHLKILPNRLGAPKIYVVPVGFKFEDGYIATKNDVDNLYKHEMGHQKYIECLNFPTKDTTFSGCYCLEDLMQIRESKVEEMKNVYYNMVKNAEKIYHDKYNNFGYPEIYECPR